MNNKVVNIIKELDQYIAEGKSRLQNILTILDWTIEDTLKESTCSPANTERNESFDRNDLPLPESFGCSNSVVIDKFQLKTIVNKPSVRIPEKFSDIQLDFTRAQKAKIYDYVIANTEKTFEPELKVSFPNDAIYNGMTFAEIVAKAKKIDKQCRRKYRTSKPTHIEELRNLVHLQMTALEKYFQPKCEPPSPSPSYITDREKNSQYRDNFEQVSEQSRSYNIEETVQTNFSESQKLTAYYHPYHLHQNRSDTREDTVRSRSPERSNRLLDWNSPSVERREHISIKIEDEISDRREDTIRRRGPDRSNRFLDWESPSVERREHRSIKIEDEISDRREDTIRRRSPGRSNRLLDWEYPSVERREHRSIKIEDAISDRREDTIRGRSTDRSNRLLDSKCRSVERREHRSVQREDTIGRQSTDRSYRLLDRKSIEIQKYRSGRRSENKDEASQIKKKHKRTKSPKKKNKHNQKH